MLRFVFPDLHTLLGGEGRADRFSEVALLTDGILGQSFLTAHY